MQINGYRSLTDALNGTHHAAALGATNKMFWSEYHRDIMNLAIDILGLEGQVLTGAGDDGSELMRPRRGAARLPRERPAGVVLLQPLRDHLGRHGRDPAQHRGRARPRAPEGTTTVGLLGPTPSARGRPSGHAELGPGLGFVHHRRQGLDAAVVLAVPQQRHRRGHQGGHRPDQERHPGARGLGDPTHQRAPIGVVPRKPMAYSAMTRPRMVGSTWSWMVELAVAMKAMDRPPMNTSSTQAVARSGTRPPPRSSR